MEDRLEGVRLEIQKEKHPQWSQQEVKTEWIQQGRGILGILRKCFPDYVVLGWVDRKSERGISNDPQMFYVNPLGRWWSYSLGEKIQEENRDGGEKKINSI